MLLARRERVTAKRDEYFPPDQGEGTNPKLRQRAPAISFVSRRRLTSLFFPVSLVAGHIGVQMRERQDAHLRSSQTGHRRDRCRVQRGLHHGRQYLAAFQGNYRTGQPSQPPVCTRRYEFTANR